MGYKMIVAHVAVDYAHSLSAEIAGQVMDILGIVEKIAVLGEVEPEVGCQTLFGCCVSHLIGISALGILRARQTDISPELFLSLDEIENRF
jgi:hypothetical protein